MNAGNGEQLPSIQSIDHLWGTWYRPLFVYSQSFAGLNHEDREELITDALLAAWNARDRYQAHFSIATWLYRIVRNKALDMLKARTRAQRRIPIVPWPQRPDGTEQELPDTRATPNSLSPQGWSSDPELEAALGLLPNEDREYLFLVYGQGLSYRELAGIVGKPEGTLKARVSRAKARLGKVLSQGGST